MKKSIIAVAVIALIFAFAAGLSFDKQKNDAMWADYGKSPSSFSIYVTPSDRSLDSAAIFSFLKDAADRYNANLIKTDYTDEGSNTITVKSVYLTFENPVLTKIPLEKGTLLKPEGMSDNYVVQTSNIAVPAGYNDIGTLNSFLGSEKIRIQPFNKLLYDEKTIAGTYEVQIKNIENKDSFIETLSQNLKMKPKDLTTQKVIKIQSSGFFIFASLAIVFICFILFALLMTYHIVRGFKKTGIYKLQGYTDFFIWKSMLSPIVFAQFSAACLAILALRLFTDIPQQYLVQLLLIGVMIIVLTLVIGLVFLIFIHRYTISDLIKNKKPFRLVYIVNQGIRFVLILTILVLFYNSAESLIALSNQYKTVYQWDKYGNQFAVFDSKVTDADNTDEEQNTHILEQKYADFYTYLNDEGAVYSSVSEYDPLKVFLKRDENGNVKYENYFDKNWVPKDFRPYVFLVNPNYLKLYKLYDENGNIINISETQKKGIYLLPASYMGNGENLQKLFKADRTRNVERSQRYAGRDNDKIKDAEIIYYKTDINVFSFDTRAGKSSDYMIKNPVFKVMTQNNGLFIDKMNLNGMDVNSPLKISLNGKSAEQVFNQLKPQITAYGLSNNITTLNSIHSVFEDEIQTALTGIWSVIGICVFLFLLCFWISVETISIKMKMRNKEISVMKSLGYTFRDKYSRDIAVFLFIWLVQFAVSAFIYSNTNAKNPTAVDPAVFLAAVPLFVLDSIILAAAFLHFDKKSIIRSIKEG